MRTAMRTHACGELRLAHAGDQVTLCGWVAHRRDHGGVTFIDLRDREGVVQLVFHPDGRPRGARGWRSSSAARTWCASPASSACAPPAWSTPIWTTGEIEVAAGRLEVLSESETPPFPIEDRIEADEDSPAQVPLPRPAPTGDDAVLRLRHAINRTIREYMDARGFVEVETPMLTTATPGGRTRLPRSRRACSPASFYALPQSPQQLKQLLMVAGQDRYYQIVRCLRDEKPRADRGFEFTQLDVEMSFVDEEDIFCGDRAAVRADRSRDPGRRGHHAVPAADLRRDDRPVRVRQAGPTVRDGAFDLTDVFAGAGFNGVRDRC